MIYKEYKPKGELAKYINKFWYLNGHFDHKREKIMPLPFIHFIINLSEPYKLFTNQKLTEYIEFKDGFVSGLQEKYLVIENPDPTSNIGVEFKPHGFYAFAPVGMNEIANHVNDASKIFPQIKIFTDQIKALKEVDDKFKLFEKFFIELRNNNLTGFDKVDRVINLIEKDFDIGLSKISDDLSLSSKHIISLVKKFTGITPKSLAMIYKFQFILAEFEKNRPKDWATFALETKFYDQSHFIKKFKDFTGFTPRKYLETLNKYDSGYINFMALDSR